MDKITIAPVSARGERNARKLQKEVFRRFTPRRRGLGATQGRAR